MIAQLRLIVLLLLGAQALSENCTLEEVVREICSFRCSNDEACMKNCTETSQTIDVPAVVTLLYQDVTFIVLGLHEPEDYVIERRLLGDPTWIQPVSSNSSIAQLSDLLPEREYEYRLHRVSVNGVSNPVITASIKSYKPTQDDLIKATMFWFEEDLGDLQHPLRLVMSLSPSVDRRCSVEATLGNWTASVHGHRFVKNERFVISESLQYETNYTVKVRSPTSSAQCRKFQIEETITTPSCVDFRGDLTVCPPPRVKDVHLTLTHRSGNIFNVDVTWNTPIFIPDGYKIDLGIRDLDTNSTSVSFASNVSGTLTSSFFPEVAISRKSTVIVEVEAYSAGGGSQRAWSSYESVEAPNLVCEVDDSKAASDFAYIAMASVVGVAWVSIVSIGIYGHLKRDRK